MIVFTLCNSFSMEPGNPQQTESESHSVVSDSLLPHGLYSPWNSPGQNTGVGSLSLLQGIFPTQGSNLGLPHCRRILYQLSHQGRLMGLIKGREYPGRCCKAEVPNPQDLMSDDVRWSWCDNTRHKVHDRCLSHPKIIPHPSPWKNCLPRKQSLVPKRLQTSAVEGLACERYQGWNRPSAWATGNNWYWGAKGRGRVIKNNIKDWGCDHMVKRLPAGLGASQEIQQHWRL